MKQFMIDMMSMMMPYMKPIAYVGVAAVLVAPVLGLARSHATSGLQAGLIKLTLGVGVFFVTCELAGRMLSMEPTLLFASDPFNRTLYRNQWPLWCVGTAFVLAGLILSKLTTSNRAET